MKLNLSTKRLQINKANTTMLILLSVAAFVTTFSLIASKGLLSQRSYQAKVIGLKKEALKNLKTNNEAADSLVQSYQQFIDPSVENIIGGNPNPEEGKEGPNDGDSARIVLDALPSKYDFPAVITSIDKLLTDLNLEVLGINGSDDEIAQNEQEVASPKPEPIEIPFSVSTRGQFQVLESLLRNIERSIRPIRISSLSFTGTNKDMNISITAKTYYQPEKSLSITREPVR